MFLPRQVVRKLPKNDASRAAPTSEDKPTINSEKPSQKGKAKEERTSEEECVALLKLTFSDFTLQTDEKLRRFVTRTRSDEDGPGFVSLSKLLDRSIYFQTTEPSARPSQLDLIRIIKAHFPHIQVRVKLSEPSTSAIVNDGYEVHVPLPQDRPQKWWEDRTVYIENIPTRFKSYSSIERFLRALDPELSIQSISFPPHHSARPDEIPRNKGFAFVVFSESSTAKAFVKAWPWEVLPKTKGQLDGERKEAADHCFRTILKSHWLVFRDEYLAYQEKLLQESRDHASRGVEDDRPQLVPPPPKRQRLEQPVPQEEPNEMLYPRDCLVFLSHVHPETNKTTLKNLVKTLLRPPGAEDILDYVDYSKGLDTCYLRFSRAAFATQFCESVKLNNIFQTSGLDPGTSSDKDAAKCKPLEAQLVQGLKEKIYWEKVPEKIRVAGVAKQTHDTQTR